MERPTRHTPETAEILIRKPDIVFCDLDDTLVTDRLNALAARLAYLLAAAELDYENALRFLLDEQTVSNYQSLLLNFPQYQNPSAIYQIISTHIEKNYGILSPPHNIESFATKFASSHFDKDKRDRLITNHTGLNPEVFWGYYTHFTNNNGEYTKIPAAILVEPVPGSEEFLRYLASIGILVGVFSNSRSPRLAPKIKACFPDFSFVGIYSAYDFERNGVVPKKPSSEGLMEALRETGFSNQNKTPTIYIGDGIVDVLASINEGIPAIIVHPNPQEAIEHLISYLISYLGISPDSINASFRIVSIDSCVFSLPQDSSIGAPFGAVPNLYELRSYLQSIIEQS